MKPAALYLLGAQRFDPNLGEVVAAAGVRGRVAIVTAGWQEREAEDEELKAHIGRRTVNLALHARAEELFAADPELRAAHRERQDALRHRQDLYRIRLEHALDALHAVQRRAAPQAIVDEESEAAREAIRELDRAHLHACAREHEAFEAAYRLGRRPQVARHRREVAQLVEGCEAIAIAGGHVATLTNRLQLFGLAALAGGKTVFAWSGGAMALSERLVLFHDDPPQGPGASEVLDAGLGLVPGVVVLPEPERRLRIDDKDRVALMARRFAPSSCLALPALSLLQFRHNRIVEARGALELHEDGSHAPLEVQPRRSR